MPQSKKKRRFSVVRYLGADLPIIGWPGVSFFLAADNVRFHAGQSLGWERARKEFGRSF